MVTKEYLQTMAKYQKWQNSNLFQLLNSIDEEELYKERGMFFGSIHKTLNHIFYTDQELFAFAQSGTPPPAFKPETILFKKFNRLYVARETFDLDFLEFTENVSPAWANETITFFSERADKEVIVSRSFYLIQMFNHGTHHRSQITSELHKLGVDYGITDLPFTPDLGQ